MPELSFTDKFQFYRRLGAGGMAEVYLAKQVGIAQFEKLVAVKTILPSQLEKQENIEMFIDEARIAAQLTHANIVQVYDFGLYQDTFYIVMEYVHGISLAKLIRLCTEKEIPFPIDLSLHIMLSICRGLDYAHRKTGLDGQPLNIIHRDLDPQNVLITFEGEVKIGDFGIASANNRMHQTTDGAMKGKVNYMSPEMIEGMQIDQRADIFALGIIFYEMLSGYKPFADRTPIKVLERVVQGNCTDLRELRPDIPIEVAATISRAMAHDRDNRFQSVREMIIEVEEYRSEFLKGDGAIHMNTFVHENFPIIIQPPINPGDIQLNREEQTPDRLFGKFRPAGIRLVDEIPERESTGNEQLDATTPLDVAIAKSKRFRPDDQDRTEPSGVISDHDSRTLVTPSAIKMRNELKGVVPSAGRYLMIALVLVGLAVAAFFGWRTLNNKPTPIAENTTPTPLPETTPTPEAPSPTATPEPAPELFGFVVVSVDPSDAYLSVDGKGVGIAGGSKKVKIPAGKKVAITASKKGFATKSTYALVQPDQTGNAVLKLEAKMGTLSIGSDVGCIASVDGTNVGATPIAAYQITAGTHTISCTNNSLGATVTSTKTVQPGGSAKATLTFMAGLSVNVKPWAEVYLDGKKLGVTPLNKFGIKPGSHTIRLVNPKLGQDMTKVRNFKPGKTVNVSESFIP